MKSKLRNAMIALFAVAATGMLAPGATSAHGVGHGGFGGVHGGFGGFHGYHRGFGFGPGVGLFAPYYYGGYYPYYYGQDCYVVRQHVHTRQGWRWRTVHVCE